MTATSRSCGRISIRAGVVAACITDVLVALGPTAASPAAASTRGLASRTIVVDPGHNGANGRHVSEINRKVFIGNGSKACNTVGTSTNDGYAESAFNWDVAIRLKALLEENGARVVLTRSDNDGWGPCIDRRAAIAANSNADASISIHADGGPAGKRGFHVITPVPLKGLNADIAARSQTLGLAVRDALDAIGHPRSNYIGRDGMIARRDLGGLNLAKVPTAFVETGNMRNPTDAALLTSPDFRQKLAGTLAAALEQFINQ